MVYRVVFLSSAEIALPLFEALHEDKRFELMTLICAPDKASGRKLEMKTSPIKLRAEKFGLEVHQPERLSDARDLLNTFQADPPDFLLTFAYGQFLNQDWLSLPKHPALNVHPSLLPFYRGSAPLQGALLNGDEKTGISIMEMVEKMDAGPIYSQLEFPIKKPMTVGILHDDVAYKVSKWLPDELVKVANGELEPRPQDESLVTFSKKVKKDDAYIDFKDSAQVVRRKFDAYTPWPGLWTRYKGKRLKLMDIEVVNEALAPGELKVVEGDLLVGCSDKSLKIKQLQLEGKQCMHADQFLIGQPEFVSTGLPS